MQVILVPCRIKKDLEHIKELMAMREVGIAELKEANGRLWTERHDANAWLVQYQLPPKPRVSFWARLFGGGRKKS